MPATTDYEKLDRTNQGGKVKSDWDPFQGQH
jgi:hypothetical protein